MESGFPHSLQNLAPSGFLIPQLGHTISGIVPDASTPEWDTVSPVPTDHKSQVRALTAAGSITIISIELQHIYGCDIAEEKNKLANYYDDGENAREHIQLVDGHVAMMASTFTPG